jgi:endonuclease G
MKYLIIFFLATAFIFTEHRPEIHCKHFFMGYPYGSPETNDLIIRDLYAMSNNDETKFADWVAYKIDVKNFDGPKRKRYWREDPWLDEIETLETEDYKEAHATIHTDRGHQAPLANFKGSELYFETNYLSNITPQKSELNQGPWRLLEEKEREIALKYKDADVYVMTGPVYGECDLSLPKADEDHKIPCAYWKIIIVMDNNKIATAAFLLPQDAERNDNYDDYLTNIDTIELNTKLDFLWEMDDEIEELIESKINNELLLTE